MQENDDIAVSPAKIFTHPCAKIFTHPRRAGLIDLTAVHSTWQVIAPCLV